MHAFQLEHDLETKSTKLKKLQRTRRLLKEEVTEEDIAGVVSRWTGIPVCTLAKSKEAFTYGRRTHDACLLI